MQEAGPFNEHGNIKREEREVVVNVVKHAVRGIHLRSELTNHACVQNHG